MSVGRNSRSESARRRTTHSRGESHPAVNARIEAKLKTYMRRFPSVKRLTVEPSTAANKRLTARFVMDGRPRTVHFGQAGAFTWADGADRAKRDAYRARASRITNAHGEYTYVIAGTANSFAYWLLW